MTEVYRPDFTDTTEEQLTYWQEREADALRALEYARRMLGMLAMENSSLSTTKHNTSKEKAE